MNIQIIRMPDLVSLENTIRCCCGGHCSSGAIEINRDIFEER
jgi:hypothetical protein